VYYKDMLTGAESREFDYLILGGSGFLGSNFISQLAKEYSVCGTYNKSDKAHNSEVFWVHFDAQNFSSLSNILNTIKPKIIINCIALANIEACEKVPTLATKLNQALPGFIAKVCDDRKILFVHISTDHFNSKVQIPRTEEESMIGINHYGKTKILGEQEILKVNSSALIIRTNFFGWGNQSHNSLLNWIIDSLSSGSIIHGYEDIFFSPISTRELIRCVNELVYAKAKGIINISGNATISKYEFVKRVALKFGYNTDQISKAKSSVVAGRTRRPYFLGLNNSLLYSILGRKIMDLDSMIEELRNDRISKI